MEGSDKPQVASHFRLCRSAKKKWIASEFSAQLPIQGQFPCHARKPTALPGRHVLLPRTVPHAQPPLHGNGVAVAKSFVLLHGNGPVFDRAQRAQSQPVQVRVADDVQRVLLKTMLAQFPVPKSMGGRFQSKQTMPPSHPDHPFFPFELRQLSRNFSDLLSDPIFAHSAINLCQVEFQLHSWFDFNEGNLFCRNVSE